MMSDEQENVFCDFLWGNGLNLKLFLEAKTERPKEQNQLRWVSHGTRHHTEPPARHIGTAMINLQPYTTPLLHKPWNCVLLASSFDCTAPTDMQSTLSRHRGKQGNPRKYSRSQWKNYPPTPQILHLKKK